MIARRCDIYTRTKSVDAPAHKKTIDVPHDGKSDVSKPVEYNDKREPDLPAVDIISVQVSIEPSDGKVVDSCQNPGCADCIVCADIRDDGNLGGEADVGKEESAEQRRERAACDPESQGVEQQLVAAVGIFLPARQLVVHGQGHSFLEALAGPSG